ncbi:MAG TPA: dipeptidase [Solirubrobacteraceae bacterium]|nr:dipeptidase [Solirubrobacteraceae bacterium]
MATTTQNTTLRERVGDLMGRAHEDLAALVACKSVADPRQFPAEECIKAAQLVIDKFTDAGLGEVRLEETPDGHPAVFGHRPAPAGAPTVLLYCHYDVQPPLDPTGKAWRTPPFELHERDGRWYGRGAADCKGNIVAHLTALRALGNALPVGVKLIAEGSEEQGTAGLERFVPTHADLLRADAIIVADVGNFAVGVPTLTTALRGYAEAVITVSTLETPMHSGMFGGPAPDALLALIRILSTLRDDRGNTTIRGLSADARWSGIDYPADQFRADAHVLDGVDLLGDGRVADLLWSRPAVTVLGIDCPPVVGSAPAVPAQARALVSLRVPPGLDAQDAQDALVEHLRAVAPWHVKVEIAPETPGQPFSAATGGPAYATMDRALEEAFGRPITTEGAGGSIPLCNVLSETFPDAEIILLGVEEPRCLIHAPNESVDPREIEHIALAEALFLQGYADRQP